MVAAGSVVLCGSVLPDADACGVAFRVAMDAHFASHFDRLPCPSPERFFLRRAAVDDVLKVMLAGHQVVLGGDLRRVSEPLGDRVGRIFLNPVRRARRPEVLEKPRP